MNLHIIDSHIHIYNNIDIFRHVILYNDALTFEHKYHVTYLFKFM